MPLACSEGANKEIFDMMKNLKNEIARLQEEIRQLREETGAMQEERTELKGKIDSAVSMLDKVDLDDVLDSIAEEVVEETEEGS